MWKQDARIEPYVSEKRKKNIFAIEAGHDGQISDPRSSAKATGLSLAASFGSNALPRFPQPSGLAYGDRAFLSLGPFSDRDEGHR